MEEQMVGNASAAATSNVEAIEKNNDLLAAKMTAMAVLGLASFVCGMLPVRLTKLVKGGDDADTKKNLLISLLLCFGGGVLLFTTFLHLQPEVRESFAALEARGKIPAIGSGIPASELVFCLGFFFVYLVEEVVHLCLDRKLRDDDALRRSLSVRCNNNNNTTSNNNGGGGGKKKGGNMCIPRVTLASKLEGEGNLAYIAAVGDNSSSKELYNSQSTVSIAVGEADEKDADREHQHQHHSHGHGHLDESIANSFRGFLAVLALSFHAVFEGLAVGLESGVQRVWYLFAAIATHKLVIAFCVGVELVSSGTRMLFVVIYVATFAIVTPLGIGAGIVLSETGKSSEDVTSLILQGMAAGTLLYVVFFEVLARERNNQHSGIWQLLAILAGFAVMFSLQIFSGHDHNHGHDHDHRQHVEPTSQHDHGQHLL